MSQIKVKNIVFKDMIVNEISCNYIDSTTNKLININNLNIDGDLSANNSSVYHNNNIGIVTTPNYNLEVIGDISFLIISEEDPMPPSTAPQLTDCEKLQIQN